MPLVSSKSRPRKPSKFTAYVQRLFRMSAPRPPSPVIHAPLDLTSLKYLLYGATKTEPVEWKLERKKEERHFLSRCPSPRRVRDLHVTHLCQLKGPNAPEHELVAYGISYDSGPVGTIVSERFTGARVRASRSTLSLSSSSDDEYARDRIQVYDEPLTAFLDQQGSLYTTVFYAALNDPQSVTVLRIFAAATIIHKDHPFYATLTTQCYWYAGVMVLLVTGGRERYTDLLTQRGAGKYGIIPITWRDEVFKAASSLEVECANEEKNLGALARNLVGQEDIAIAMEEKDIAMEEKDREIARQRAELARQREENEEMIETVKEKDKERARQKDQNAVELNEILQMTSKQRDREVEEAKKVLEEKVLEAEEKGKQSAAREVQELNRQVAELKLRLKQSSGAGPSTSAA